MLFKDFSIKLFKKLINSNNQIKKLKLINILLRFNFLILKMWKNLKLKLRWPKEKSM